VVGPGLVSPDVRAGNSGHEEGHVDEHLIVDASTSARVPEAKTHLVEVAPTCEIAAFNVALMPRRPGAIDRGAVCGRLMERLHDVSLFHSHCSFVFSLLCL
jgi:hypothetical protein